VTGAAAAREPATRPPRGRLAGRRKFHLVQRVTVGPPAACQPATVSQPAGRRARFGRPPAPSAATGSDRHGYRSSVPQR